MERLNELNAATPPNVDRRYARRRVPSVSPALPDLYRHCGAAPGAHGDAPVRGPAALHASAATLHRSPACARAGGQPARYLPFRTAAAILCADLWAEHLSVSAGL